jgi:hypothetical protein
MSKFSDICDDHYINLNLSTETSIPHERTSVMFFFEQLRKRYPAMKNFYSRDKNDFVLEQDKDGGSYRWVTLENKRLCSGFVNPESVADAMEQHHSILDSIPHTLSISPLDCETLNLTYGFDFAYQGNQHQLIADALGMSPAFENGLQIPGAKLVSYDPVIQLALDPECKIQCRLGIESRTTAFHVRTGEFPEDNLSVFFTLRKYGGIEAGETYESTFRDLSQRASELIDEFVTQQILLPLQNAILIN